MSIARHHAEWLSLVEASGPFLSLPVLLEVFPSGLEAHEPEHLRRLKLAHEEWQDNQQGARPDPAIHRAWVEFVLQETLGFPDEVLLSGQAIPAGLSVTQAEHQETLRPDWVVVNPKGTEGAGKPRLVVQVVPPSQDLEKGLKGSRWAASLATRMMELLHACDVRLGLLTNGDRWMLVNAPKGETTGYISWYATLWQEEKVTLQAFRSLLGVSRFFGVEDSETLEEMLAKSVNSQQEVTDQLGYQVRQAVEVLVQSIDRIDQDRRRSLLKGLPETRLYESALTVMMRLVFLFFAEENNLIPSHETEFYDTHYAVSTLRSRLREEADQSGEEILERKHDAWCRLLATFRAVHGGVSHDALEIPAYGGSLFDPDRFPFLEGRDEDSCWLDIPATPIPINNRTVLHLLEALQVLQIKVPGGGIEPRKLSFRALDIEQIGHVYEGLLDHTAVRATEPILGLEGTRDKEPEISLAELERLREKGESDLIAFLKKETGRSQSALQKRLSGADAQVQERSSREAQRLLIACNNDRGLLERVLPWAQLIRLDTFEYPVVIPAGSVFVTQGSDRRQTGTHYTPRSLTEEIVKYTLEPLVYEGVAEGKPKEEWRLKSAAELLRLKVCDMAMGSGAFLVQTCRYLGERLEESWKRLEQEHPGQILTVEGQVSYPDLPEELIPQEAAERALKARRLVADRCLYGVDKNPLAVEMAKLSLWLITLQKNRPFTFLDHALKCGDSLLGITRAEQIEYLHLNPEPGVNTYPIASQIWRPILQDAIAKRRKLESFSVNGIEDLQEKERLFQEAEQAIARLRFVGDYLIGRTLADAGKTSDLTTEDLLMVSQRIEQELAGKATEEQTRDITALRASAERMLNLGNPTSQAPRKPFHWLLEFPEVFLEGETKGFAAIVGNPPFQGGQKITGAIGTDYRNFLVEFLANGQRGSADLCAYFFLQANRLTHHSGGFGLVATNTIAQGDTREVGLDQLATKGCAIYRAIPSRPWIGSASLEVAYIWLYKQQWRGDYVLDEKAVAGITSFLTTPGKAIGKPYQLITNKNKSYIGSYVLGMGFVLAPEEARMLIEKNPKNREVLFPYLNGEDLNSHFNQLPSRWVINFFDMPLDADSDDPKNPKGSPYAIDYSDCMEIVKKRVKPDRDRLSGGDASARDRAKRWWQFARPTINLYSAISSLDRVLVFAQTSKTKYPTFVNTEIIFDQKLVVIVSDSNSVFSVLCSHLHYWWVLIHGCSLRTDAVYTPSDCFETFPFPTPDPSDLSTQFPTLNTIGETYYIYRQAVMRDRQEGLTKTYNRFHDPNETADDIQKLRELHIEMDQAVASAYGWQDLDLGHDFHTTKQGIRFTVSETARREVLDRLLELNHQRYAEEVAQGLHDKKKAKGKGQKAKGKVSKKQQPDAESGDQQLKLL